MSDVNDPQAPAKPPLATSSVVPPAAAEPEPRARTPVLAIVGFVVLAGGLIWLWTQVQDVTARVQQAETTRVDPARLSAAEDALASLGRRVQALQDRPVPQPAPQKATEKAPEKPPLDLAPLEQRLAALEQRPAPTPPPPPPPVPAPLDDTALKTRLDALGGSLDELGRKLTAAEARAAAAETRATENAAQAAAMTGKLDDLSGKLAEARASAGKSAETAATAQRVEATALALAAGRPLGPQTVPALSAFATEAPPTEASLRLSFEDAARAAQTASDPALGSDSFGKRMLERVQTLVTIRSGDHVLVGAPAAEVLADARAKLVAGDLAGTLGALDRLDPPAAKAMAGWRERAQALLDARAALAGMVR